MKTETKMTSEDVQSMRQRVGVENAIDHELSACVSRIMGMNGSAGDALLVARFRRIVAEVSKQFEKLGLSTKLSVRRAATGGNRT